MGRSESDPKMLFYSRRGLRYILCKLQTFLTDDMTQISFFSKWNASTFVKKCISTGKRYQHCSSPHIIENTSNWDGRPLSILVISARKNWPHQAVRSACPQVSTIKYKEALPWRIHKNWPNSIWIAVGSGFVMKLGVQQPLNDISLLFSSPFKYHGV